jgi:hypothetical protein
VIAWLRSWTPFSQIVALMVVSFVVGAVLGGWVFELFHPIPPAAAVSVRGSLALSFCSFVAFVLSVFRIARGEKPLDLHIPPDWSPVTAMAVAILIGYLIGTSIFK